MTALAARFWRPALLLGALCSLISMRSDFGSAGSLLAAESHRAFASFNAKVDIDIEDGEIDVIASFTLDPASNGIDLAKEVLTLQLSGGGGAFSVSIPAGSFKAERGGAFKFQGIINRVKFDASLRPTRKGSFDFEVETAGASLKGFANPVTLTLIVGDDGGSRTVRAEIE